MRQLNTLIDVMQQFVQVQLQGTAIAPAAGTADEGLKKRGRRSRTADDRSSEAAGEQGQIQPQEPPARAGRRRGGDDDIVDRRSPL